MLFNINFYKQFLYVNILYRCIISHLYNFSIGVFASIMLESSININFKKFVVKSAKRICGAELKTKGSYFKEPEIQYFFIIYYTLYFLRY